MQTECVIILYNESTVRASIKQINIITKRITPKISVLCAIRQNIKSELIIVKFRFKKKTESEQAINLSHSHIKY